MNTIPIIPRIEDLPYHTSPAIEFTYQSSATVNGGIYTWSDPPTALTPDRPIMVNSLYYFRSITLSANVEELDFTSNVGTIIKFQTYLKSNAKVVLFREPIFMVKFFQNFDYRLAWNTKQQNDKLYASFNGTLNQGASLIGKRDITLTAVISCQEVTDDRFVSYFKKGYPVKGGE